MIEYNEDLEAYEEDMAYEYEEQRHYLNEAQEEQAELEWMQELYLRCCENGAWEI
jgi:hypothetical protein